MSAQDEFALVQRIVSVLYQRGHMMTRFTIEYLLRELNVHIERMIQLNDTIERNHLDEQVLLLQQLNESNEANERRRVEEQQSQFINNQYIFSYNTPTHTPGPHTPGQENVNIDMDVDDGSSFQTELDDQPFTVNPPIYRRLFVTSETSNMNNLIERSKVIARRKLEEACPAECSVCQETPKYKDAVYTECSHYYCKGCWESWMNAEGSNKKCPTCRKDMPRITVFKGRAPNRRHVV
jgi:hypothetical protein